MIDARRILTVGVDCSKLRGGVSAVEIQYSKIYHPWRHVATSTTGSSVKKLFVFLLGVAKFLFLMIFVPQIKVVHIHSASYNSFKRKRVIINISKSFKKKVVFHCHGAEFKLFTSRHKQDVIRTLSKCNCVVCLSKSWKQWFEQECGCKNVVIINNIIPAPTKIDRQVEKLIPLTLLFLGELGPRKGIYDLLDVMAELKDRNIKLLIGGNGDVEGVVSRINQLGINDSAKCLGWVSGDEKIELLNQSDVFVLPSYNEGLPISILEAMSYGMPIISTRVGGIPEIVNNGHNGILIEPGNKEQLLNALCSIIGNDELRIELGCNSELIALNYQPENVEKQLKAMYQSLTK